MIFQPTLPPVNEIAYDVEIETSVQNTHYETIISTYHVTPKRLNQFYGHQKGEVFDKSPAFEQLMEIAKLHADWDGYGAEEICKECIDNAKSIISALPANVPPPDIFPNTNGTITLEWEADAGIFSIEIGKESFSSFIDASSGIRYCHEPYAQGMPDFVNLAIRELFPQQVVPAITSFTISRDKNGSQGFIFT